MKGNKKKDVPNEEECYHCGRWFPNSKRSCPHCGTENPDHNPYTRYVWGKSQPPKSEIEPVDN